MSSDLEAWYDKECEPARQRLHEVVEALSSGVATHTPELVYVTGRVKAKRSFLEKAVRKGYDDPVNQIQDLVGTRIVVRRSQHLDDARLGVKKVAAANGWSILSEQERGSEAENAQVPGYHAVHLILQMMAEDPCSTVEVQIMTMLQNAWAVLQHDLVYKGKPDPRLARRATSLAGLLELAEKEFEDLRLEVSGGLQQLPPRLERPRDVDTLVGVVCDVPLGPAAEGRTAEWSSALLQVIEELDLVERDRLLDALGDAAEREELVRKIISWRPWMNGYLITDFLLRLKVPGYFDRRMKSHPTRDKGARSAFDAEISSFHVHDGASAGD